MQYTPTLVGKIALGTRDELQRISAVLNQVGQSVLPLLAVAPQKPKRGMLVLCDGANWDPLGDGESQPVWYDGAAWLSLGTSSPAVEGNKLMGWFLQ